MNFRVNETVLEQFESRCAEFTRKPNDVARELIQAYAEGRITIEPTEGQKAERSTLYHESGK
jgi:hypothetical protein